MRYSGKAVYNFVYRFFVVFNLKSLDNNFNKMYNINTNQIVGNHQKESRAFGRVDLKEKLAYLYEEKELLDIEIHKQLLTLVKALFVPTATICLILALSEKMMFLFNNSLSFLVFSTLAIICSCVFFIVYISSKGISKEQIAVDYLPFLKETLKDVENLSKNDTDKFISLTCKEENGVYLLTNQFVGLYDWAFETLVPPTSHVKEQEKKEALKALQNVVDKYNSELSYNKWLEEKRKV